MCFGENFRKITKILILPFTIFFTSYLLYCSIILLIRATEFHLRNNQQIVVKIKIAFLRLFLILLRFVVFLRILLAQFNIKVKDTKHLLI